MVSKREKAEKNITYCRVQMERFLDRHYKVPFRGSVYGNKYLYKERRSAKTVFLERGKVEVDVDYQLLVKGNKEKLLHAVLREAVRVALWFNGKPYQDGCEEFEEELKKHRLPSYGGLPEYGLDLHTYVCSQCKKVWALKVKRIPSSKDPSLMDVKTGCCQAVFEYTGKIHYENTELQKMLRVLKNSN